jgi:hypothetical protein
MTLKLTDLHPFAGDSEWKSAVAQWRKLAAELDAAGSAQTTSRLKTASRHAVAAARRGTTRRSRRRGG